MIQAEALVQAVLDLVTLDQAADQVQVPAAAIVVVAPAVEVVPVPVVEAEVEHNCHILVRKVLQVALLENQDAILEADTILMDTGTLLSMMLMVIMLIP